MNNRKYKYPKTTKLIKQLRPYLVLYKKIEEDYYKRIGQIETILEKITGIPEIELFFCDNECVGVGNSDRSMELIRWSDINTKE